LHRRINYNTKSHVNMILEEKRNKNLHCRVNYDTKSHGNMILKEITA